MIENNNNTLRFLREDRNYYLSNKSYKLDNFSGFLPKDFCLYHIEELTFEEKSPRKEALENVLSSLRLEGINLVYLIVGDKKGVHFYFGVAKDLTSKGDLDLEINDIGENILEPSIKGNFRGSKVKKVGVSDRWSIKNQLGEMSYYGVLEGVPGINEDNENFQGVDRLVDVMLGDEFYISIIASPLNRGDILDIEKNLYRAYSQISPLSKSVVQGGQSDGTSISDSESDSKTETKGSNSSTSETQGTSTNKSVSESTSYSQSSGTGTNTNQGSSKNTGESSTSKSGGESTSSQKTNGGSSQDTKGSGTSQSTTLANGESKSISEGKTVSKSNTTNIGSSINLTTEYLNREAQEWLKYLDDVIIPRLDYGKSKGLFLTTTFIGTNNKANLIKLGNTMKSLYSGVEGNKVPLEMNYISKDVYLDYYKNFQIPFSIIKNSDEDNRVSSSVISQFVKNNIRKHGNWISSNELSLIAGLPQKEVVGLSLKEEVEFGLNIDNRIEDDNKIYLGDLVQSGNKLEINVYLDKENLNKHTFITGVTGSGKTTTCQKILMDSELPFMVIEPAKTEYRVLTESYDDVLIFTLGKDNVAPFRLNPFEFYPHENITSRVDMIKACLESSFDMEAAIPQLIETAIYKCYEDKGWNIGTNKNYKFKNPFENGIDVFPTISDLIKRVEQVVEEQGFDDRLKRDYIGSIKARLQGLTVGSKGLMLNTKRSIDFRNLLNKKVILELEEIKNGNEKSIIMGFVLINLNEAIKANFNNNPDFRHITLVEEAHRLLSKYEHGDSLNKKQGVETFADMLAEVRKYGESLIIVDQIPNKLTPEVLKNTNTKIVHKIFAQDDKEAIGNTMALKDEQKEFLSSLDVGRAIVFTQGWDKSIQVQVKASTNTTKREQISEDIIRENALRFYCENYKSGVIEGLEYLEEEPSIEFVGKYLEFSQDENFIDMYKELVKRRRVEMKFGEYVENYINDGGVEEISQFIFIKLYANEVNKSLDDYRINIESFLRDIESGKLRANDEISASRTYLNQVYIGR